MSKLKPACVILIGAVAAAYASIPTSCWASDRETKSAAPQSYFETIYQPDCPADEHCRLSDRCAVCDTDTHP